MTHETPIDHKPTLLIVDDVPENLRILADLLLQAGMSPRPVTSAQAAMKLLQTITVDLILLDINMPEMDGFAFCTWLKDDPKYRDIPVIFLSAAQDVAHKVEGFRRGGVDYVTKPFQFEEVRARVTTHLQIRRLQREQAELLERTLGGVVNLLVDCLQVALPSAFVRSDAVRACVGQMLDRHNVKDRWPIQVASSLAFVGCLTLPDDLVDLALGRQQPEPDVEERFFEHAQKGKRLLLDVPRLDEVAEIIGAQYHGPIPDRTASMALGARMLRIAQVYCAEIGRGVDTTKAHAKTLATFPGDEELVEHVRGFRAARSADAGPIRGTVSNIVDGATLLAPVKMPDGTLLLAAGQVVTPVLRLRLLEYVKAKRIDNAFLFKLPD